MCFACVCVSIFYPERLGEGVRFPGTGVMDVVSFQVDSGT